jgi:hypothetical protein
MKFGRGEAKIRVFTWIKGFFEPRINTLRVLESKKAFW